MKKAYWVSACLCAAIAGLPAYAGAQDDPVEAEPVSEVSDASVSDEASSNRADERGRPIPGQYIVVLDDDENGKSVAEEHRRSAGARVLHTYDSAFRGYSAQLRDDELASVRRDPRVVDVIQDREAVSIGAQTLTTGINRVDAEMSQTSSYATSTSAPVAGSVAVMDTGIDTSHPDLNVAGGVNCLGAIDAYNDGTINDKHGHGTHIGGVIGAKNNDIGTVGMAPGVALWSVRVNDSLGVSSTSRQLCGINWVTQNAANRGIKVVNASQALIGSAGQGTCGSDVLHQAICNSTAAGVTWVFSAMNSTKDFKDVGGAGYDEVLTVTAMADSNGQPNVGSTTKFSCKLVLSGAGGGSGVDDTAASFSNWATLSSDIAHTIAAPGVCIYSTWKGSSYGYLSGTSMAAPHVAGLVHLCILSGECSGTPAQNIDEVRSDAYWYNAFYTKYGFKGDPLRPTSGKYYGYLPRAAGY